MKKVHLLLLSAFVCSAAYADDIDASSSIYAVTVFPDRADVSRSADITIPAGFVYSNEVVEFTKEIPRVIFREGFGFKRMLSGFFDLELLLSIRGVSQDKLLNTFLGTMIAYPREVGRQIAACPQVFEEIDEFVWQMQTMFGVRALLLVIGFWDVAQTKNAADALMCTLARQTLEQSPVSADDLADGKTLLGITCICGHFDLFLSKGVPQTAVNLFKKHVSDAIAALIVLLLLLCLHLASRCALR